VLGAKLRHDGDQPAPALTNLDLTTVSVHQAEVIAPAIEKLKGRANALYVCVTPFINTKRSDINSAALAAGLPNDAWFPRSSRFRRADVLWTFAILAREQAGALLTNSESLFMVHSDHLAALTARHALPALYAFRENATAGGLMSYGANFLNAARELGLYTGRILKGENPSDLPVQQATKIEFVINMKTAKALGIEIPLPLLGRADEVIE
jgi:ABC-type uncharacterized transport system substrate-binding protein